jgi:hypothetical protein
MPRSSNTKSPSESDGSFSIKFSKAYTLMINIKKKGFHFSRDTPQSTKALHLCRKMTVLFKYSIYDTSDKVKGLQSTGVVCYFGY